MGLSTEATLRAINEDRALGASMLFSHRHPQPSPPFHIEMMDLWRSANEFVAIEAFREGAKTTLSEEFLLMEALFGNFKYLLIFGETYTKACQRIEAMKHELLTNQRIYTLFGKQKGAIWSENKIVLPNSTAIEAHGWEEEIRGFKYLDARPDRAYLDDIENTERVRDKSAVDKSWKKLHMELLPAMDKSLGKIRITGTPLADDCLIRRCAESPDWVSARYPICNGDIDSPQTESLWDSRYSMEWIRKKKSYYESSGMLREFNQEYMLIATGSQGKPFEEEMLRYADIAPRTYSPKIAIIDPARTVDIKKSDQTGYVVVSRIGTKLYIHESGAKYWQPNEIVNSVFDLSRKYDDCEVAIEKNSLDNWLLQPIRSKMLQTGHSIRLKTLTAPQDRDKSQFIMGLHSFFCAGDVVFVGGRAQHSQLISQILNFPSGKKDIINALAYSNRVFSGEAIYPDFSDDNITEGFYPERNAKLLLACNSDSSVTTVVLCSITEQYLTVVADWVSPLLPVDVIPDISKLIKVAYPGYLVTAWVPADIYDQVGRNPLVTALKAAKIPANRSEYATMSRGSLSPVIRTTSRGRRLFMVDSSARATLQALSIGYNFPTKNTGETTKEPERNSSKTLMEGLEALTFYMNKSESQVEYKTNALNATGVPYRSALSKSR